MVKKALKLAGFGFVLGIAVCTVISILMSDGVPASNELIERIGTVKAALLIQALLSGIHGAICMGTTVIYDAEKLPLALMSLIHCVICVGLFIPVSLFLCWTKGLPETLIMTAVQTASYFVIWLIMNIIYKKQIKELNEMQKQLNDKQ